jgi:hypothetical protein
MLAQHGPVPEISTTFDPATRCYGFSTRLPGMRPHWMIDTFTSLEDALGRSVAGAHVGGAERCGRESDTRFAEREAVGVRHSARAADNGSGDETQLAHFVMERKQLLRYRPACRARRVWGA